MRTITIFLQCFAFATCLAALVMVYACDGMPLGSETIRCASGLVCPPGTRCVQGGEDCLAEGTFCGDGEVEPFRGESCEDGNRNNDDNCPDGAGGTCQPARCGDGFVNKVGGEKCDPNAPVDLDAGMSDEICRSDCLGYEKCGNGRVETGEVCDLGDRDGDGARDLSAGCDDDCTLPTCGDGIVNNAAGEQCELFMKDAEDHECRPDCKGFAFCGNGLLDPDEGCDDGISADGDSTDDFCPSGLGLPCQLARCGDGFVHAGVEACDTMAPDGGNCRPDCLRLIECGNGLVDPGEACDDANDDNSDSCPDGEGGTCQIARCGDGFVRDGVEVCDPNSDDTCRPDCRGRVECGNGILEPGNDEECDDGVNALGSSCPGCKLARCGDGHIRAGVERCDPGPDGAGSTCRLDCLDFKRCGNGLIDNDEQCDAGTPGSDSPAPDRPGCDSDCTIPMCGDGLFNPMAEDCEPVLGIGCTGGRDCQDDCSCL